MKTLWRRIKLTMPFILAVGVFVAMAHVWWLAPALVIASIVLIGYLVVKSVRSERHGEKKFDFIALIASIVVTSLFIGIVYWGSKYDHDEYPSYSDEGYDDRDAMDYWDLRTR